MSRRLTFSVAVLSGAAALYVLGLTLISQVGHVNLTHRDRGLYVGYEFAKDQAGIIRQKTFSDCGTAALKMLAELHHVKADVSQLQQNATLFGVEEGTMLSALRATFHKEFKVKKTRLSNLPDSDIPAIVLHDGHFSVLQKRWGNQVQIMDPWFGRVVGRLDAGNWNVNAIVPEAQPIHSKEASHAKHS